MQSRTERSAGGVVYRIDGDAIEIALASRRTRRGDLAWGLPKGLIEPEEDPSATAVREVREETGLEAEIVEDLGDISYVYVWDRTRVHKTVRFFLMRATGGDISRHDHEMEEVRWFPLDETPGTAAFKSEREVLARASAILKRGDRSAAP